ncbi:DUF3558 domain-containing protein [Nocardia cyriacigeorgica]|uniref:DUF3558 domain-containing protein n=1 Tax=Nocardia cyriacigeorgica TaxID=135487 RepID=UPI0018954941|nr:DUF3558 domain-containing protein [Nocardia cyriacigeorgica]MBF6454703.1 DUF3558 domain-containing protein [Nocardia cyriacigeorgica]MBF6479693.1 DUF3558 domain-containing protein [Nocardia cyriacigeorgica]MBF6552597.1 DUF3558 domain-containing protein [Nocardia cyriacigeorgica]
MNTKRTTAGVFQVLGAAVLLAGCGSVVQGSAVPAGQVLDGRPIADEVPSGFNPCTDIPQSVLDSEGLHGTNAGGVPTKDDSWNRGKGARWMGCRWVVSDGYATNISVTNLTLDHIRHAKHLEIVRDTTVAGRAAVATHQADSQDTYSCELYVDMEGGSLEFGVDNMPSNRKTGHLYSCDLAVGLAEKVVPLIPDGV